MNFQPNTGICIPARKPGEKQSNANLEHPQGRGLCPGPGPRAQTGGAVGLRLIIFPQVILHFRYAYTLIEMGDKVRLDFISNVFIILPEKAFVESRPLPSTDWHHCWCATVSLTLLSMLN